MISMMPISKPSVVYTWIFLTITTYDKYNNRTGQLDNIRLNDKLNSFSNIFAHCNFDI